MRRKSEKTKRFLKMGTGSGADYRPYIQNGEFGSVGTAVKAIDWKTGRSIHLLSQTELKNWTILRWDDDNIDIREQFPLDLKTTLILADKYGIRHPSADGIPKVMTTDFYITRKDKDVAVTVKESIDIIEQSKRITEKLYLEKKYYEYKGVDFKILTNENIDEQVYINIRDVTEHYNDTFFADEITFAKFLIAHKYLKVDMTKKLDYQEIIKEEEFIKWTNLTLLLATSSK